MKTIRIDHETQMGNGPGAKDALAFFEPQSALRRHPTYGFKLFAESVNRVIAECDVIQIRNDILNASNSRVGEELLKSLLTVARAISEAKGGPTPTILGTPRDNESRQIAMSFLYLELVKETGTV
jgi:hypothetical protein